MSTTALEITCAKPDCHWKGSPSDAPTHPCPTPAEAAEPAAAAPAISPFAGMPDASGEPIVDDNADESKRYHVVWHNESGDKTLLIGTSDDEAGAFALVELTSPGKGQVEIVDRGEQPADAAPSIAYDADPSTEDELEAWLLAHGNYDEAGVPQDERTATLEARLSVFAEDEPADVLEAPGLEPELEASSAAAEVLAMDDVPADLKAAAADALASEAIDADGPRPWETVIAEALDSQTAVKEYRWLVVWHPEDETREAELIGRGKVKTEAVVIQEDVESRGQLKGRLDVVKTNDVLEAAAEIEKKRELVEEPGKVVEPSDEPVVPIQPDDSPAAPKESIAAAAARAQAAQPAPPVGKAAPLFDASDFEREDLALPKVDGHSIDRIAVDISGSVMLDRSNPDHVALWRRMKLGAEVELWVTAKGLGFAGKGATNKEGDLDVVVGRRSIAINTLRIIPAEGLQAAADELAAQARSAHETGEDGLENV